ncbi:MAG TPA: HAD-IIIC family phosphatase [Alphaproteobacteria bacterium]|jgi:FkbH-like protein|nr:HAD-IIIC family phosphatase [Alphaproteobacteria bacterium]
MTPSTAPLSLYWLPPAGDFSGEIAAARDAADDAETLFRRLVALAGRRLDFTQTLRLDRLLIASRDRLPARAPRLRLALAGNATLEQLAPGIRVGALRRGLLVDTLVAPFGQWRQQILDPGSALYDFKPDAIALLLDAHALLPELPLSASAQDAAAAVETAVDDVAQSWRTAQDHAQAAIIQLVPWLDEPPVLGHLEHRVPAARGALWTRLTVGLTEAAAAAGVALLDLRAASRAVGTQQLSDPALWYHAKQSIAPAAASWIGDHVARILGALRGLSKKVLVLDLDNTLWGGTIGDDGLDGIVLGQGSGPGEAYAGFQRYAKRLAERGILLAVSSKNEPAIVHAAFERHPEMVLRRRDFAAMEIGWGDKPQALRRIAKDLALGLDSLVFVDDNPAERELVRRTLPAVAVPELPEAPELYARCLADAGYYETVAFTGDDTKRTAHYAANRERRQMQSAATDIESFLRDLRMTLSVGPFGAADVPRIAQLINKTNQFNLTTRRYTEAEVGALMQDPGVVTLAARLADRFGDNGLTTVIIGRKLDDGEEPVLDIDSWLMSCRILGRRVEHAMLTVIAEKAGAAGARRLIGHYRPTPRNGIVRSLYAELGFTPVAGDEGSGETAWALSLGTAPLPPTDHVSIVHNG